MPGITALGLSDTLPPSGGTQATFLSAIEIPAHAKFSAGTGGMIGYRFVTRVISLRWASRSCMAAAFAKRIAHRRRSL